MADSSAAAAAARTDQSGWDRLENRGVVWAALAVPNYCGAGSAWEPDFAEWMTYFGFAPHRSRTGSANVPAKPSRREMRRRSRLP